MILHALQSYYQRERLQPDTTIPPEGFDRLDMHCLIHLDLQGKCTGFDFKDSDDGGIFLNAPKDVDRSSNIEANFLWDKLEYILGYCKEKEADEEKTKKCTDAFLDKIVAAFDKTHLPELQAVITFLRRNPLAEVEKFPSWQDVLKSKKLSFRATFCVQRSAPLIEHPEVVRYVSDCWEQLKAIPCRTVCLVSGQTEAPIALSHPKIKGFPGMGTGIKLISFDNETFFSHRRQGNENAPISMDAAFQYSTALTHLLRRESKQKKSINDVMFLFWATEKTKRGENVQGYLTTDDPERRNDLIDALLNAPGTGNTIPADEDDMKVRFYILGLTAPNKGRLAVRYWLQANVAEVSGHIAHHLKDIAIRRHDGSVYYATDWQLLADMRDPEKKKKDDSVYTGATIALWESALEGASYPALVYRKIVGRCLKEQNGRDKKTRKQLPNVTDSRAAFVKAYLIRSERSKHERGERNHSIKEDYLMDWQEEIPNPAYALGGMFALYERLQSAARKANMKEGDVDTSPTLRDRYFSTACRRPGIVFPKLEPKATSYYRKLKRNKASYPLAIWFEREIGSLSRKIASSGKPIPMITSIEDQGYFIMGYHQKLHKAKKESGQSSEKGENND